MTKEEHNKILNDLKNCTTDADRMNLIVALETDYTGLLGERDNAVTKATNAEAECIKYAKLNNELWLKSSAIPNSGQNTNIEENKETPPQKRSFEDLESKFE